MSTNHEQNGEDELQAARRTAYALGQTSGAEEADVKAELAASPQARHEVEAVAALAARLKESAREVPPPVRSPALRQAIEGRLAELEPAAGRAAATSPTRKKWQRSLVALALVASLLALAMPIEMSVRRHGTGRDREMAKNSLGLAQSAPAAKLPSENMIPKGLCAVPVQISAESIHGGLVLPQSRVDVQVLVRKDPSLGLGEPLCKTILQDIKVFSVNDATSTESRDPKATEDLRSTPSGKTVSLLVTPSQAQMVTLAGQLGSVRLILRSSEDSEKAKAESIGSSELLGLSGGRDRADMAPQAAEYSDEGRGFERRGDAFLMRGIAQSGGTVPSGPAPGLEAQANGAALGSGNGSGSGEQADSKRHGVQLDVYGVVSDALPALQTPRVISVIPVTPSDGRITGGVYGQNGDQNGAAGGLSIAGDKPHAQQPSDGESIGGHELLGLSGRGDRDKEDSDKVVEERFAKWAGELRRTLRESATPDAPANVAGDYHAAQKPTEEERAVLAAGLEQVKRFHTMRAGAGTAVAKSDEQKRERIETNDKLMNPLEAQARIRELRESLRGELENLGANDEQSMALRKALATELSKESDPGKPELAAVQSKKQELQQLKKEVKRLEEQVNNVARTQRDLSSSKNPGPQKPVVSWKPAHVVPNSSRLMVGEREELPLKGMQVDVRVDGFRARVLIDLYYFNDRPQQLEGNFQLRLPDEASPYFFAFGRTVYQAPQVTASDSMFFKPQQVSQGDTTPEKILALRGNSWEQPKVARMVPKEKAALAYRDTVRRRVDPALVEWSGAGVFQCRVFPLAPQSLHRVTIGYDVDLTRVGEDLELRLDLPGQTPATIVDLNIAASDARQVSLDAPATALTPGPSPGLPSTAGGRGETLGPATGSADGQRLSYRLIDPKERPLAVRLRKPGVQMLTGSDEVTGNFFATRVSLPLPETLAVNRTKQAVFLVDTSLSAGPQFPLWTKLLRATLENNRDSIKEFAVLFFNVETFWWQEKFVANTPENVEAVMTYADGLALEGATDLGRALKEAAAPKWQEDRKGFSPSPDLFLLSDGAATWGEDRWALLAAELKRVPSPNLLSTAGGRGESATGPALFAYRTGLAGGDPRCLAYLAEQTGGALFSLVGEAEIASASVAHRNRPWRLTGIEMAGSHDLLVAGRPQYVFPGQQLLVVGRLEVPSPAAGEGSIVFTLQQGSATQTIRVRPEQVLTSELAARTFGQVATSQLEDVSGVAAAAEPAATAYARHFRVTGRTCSLLMLESEQDYARFNIKPEEDSFVVKDQPADPIVAKAVAEATATMSDPKANFLAWYRRVQQSSEVHFDLPAALKVAIESLPAETFAVAAPPLACKLRFRKELPQELQKPWQSGLAGYDTLAAEAQRRLTAFGADDAMKALSSLVEERPGDAALQRDLAFSAIEWQRPGEAYHLLRRAGAGRTFEPVTFHALAHCLELMRRADLAIVYYELACGGQWDARFGDMHNIAQLDYLRFLRRVAGGQIKTSLSDYAKARLATLAAMQLRDTADVAALIFWNTDGTDVDLHVIEPSGEECFYQHAQTASGGHISRDVTTGYGPELYLLPAAPAGMYRVSAHYYATDANRASTRTKVLALIYEGWGTKDERVTIKATALTGQKENHELATVKR